MIKTLTLLIRRDDWTPEQFHRYWRDVHGPLARKVKGIRRYVQSEIIDELIRQDIAEMGIAVDGIAEVWYDSREAMQASRSSAEGQALLADSMNFIGRSRTLVIREVEMIGMEPGDPRGDDRAC